ncbi:Alkylated DNA nucleotide flippase Atl1, participates in nucleotide excision repair, Ada-like DNA-binding domain [Arthrobacter alpinus]|uniref:Alkylated DNA nucleotide flippase Atl1, participates in nucleotide excision repair, Ada-like DNA-binding domain n=1 Tax=Arthrobacter alpinus TaxID=656366 RepID=A0A1H5DV58_9MICC|nr:MGMT family protein [Arthrobacter alpinus]SED82779.1 Alkylated DNA nucleotide flippase Atl1, participates in nucleotide excision repair, Ada-like DNA-binding domain [Arthrobacter alpinus]
MREQYLEAVLAVADLIPPARVLSYGDIAALLESGGPRQVGAVMAAQGSTAPWWRVIRAGGQAPQGHERRALEHYRQEQTALRGDTAASWRVDMKAARWNPTEAEFDLIDAIAATLQEADDAGSEMSVPRDGIQA